MVERAGYYSFGYDGSETRHEVEVEDGSTLKMIEAMMALPPAEPYLLISPKMLQALRTK